VSDGSENPKVGLSTSRNPEVKVPNVLECLQGILKANVPKLSEN
jgi:hypothetical protein